MYIENGNIKTKSNDTHFQSKKKKILSIQVDMIKVLTLIMSVELNINL